MGEQSPTHHIKPRAKIIISLLALEIKGEYQVMISEFIERTDFEPTADEYAKIEEAYYNFNGDKNAFCKAFIDGNGVSRICRARAEEISRLRSVMLETERQFKNDIEERDRRIEHLTAELDRELEWKPSENTGTNMSQYDYDHLARSGRKMSDGEAKAFIADEYGFAPEKICILHEVSSYEVNKHRYLRKSNTYERTPMYESTDWNYVRFNCAQFMYELVNGELRFYCC